MNPSTPKVSPGFSPARMAACRRICAIIEAAEPLPRPDYAGPPPEALSKLKENIATTFANGQVWTLRNGEPVRVPPPEVLSKLKENIATTFKNGEVWTLRNGRPVRMP